MEVLVSGGVGAIAIAVIAGVVRIIQWIVWVWLAARISTTLGVAGLKELPAVARAMSWTARASKR